MRCSILGSLMGWMTRALMLGGRLSINSSWVWTSCPRMVRRMTVASYCLSSLSARSKPANTSSKNGFPSLHMRMAMTGAKRLTLSARPRMLLV